MNLGVRTFTASVSRDRGVLGERVTEFIGHLRELGGRVVDWVVTQSSDAEFHCVTIVLLYHYVEGGRP